MKPALWIPCYNDGDNLCNTLRLLWEKVRAWIFEHIIVTNDGSDDNTIELLKELMRNGKISGNKFTILWEQWKKHNRGKMGRFFEVLNFARDKLHLNYLVTSDADMVNVGWNAFDLLGQENTDMPMRVSYVWEWWLNDECVFGPKQAEYGQLT